MPAEHITDLLAAVGGNRGLTSRLTTGSGEKGQARLHTNLSKGKGRKSCLIFVLEELSEISRYIIFFL